MAEWNRYITGLFFPWIRVPGCRVFYPAEHSDYGWDSEKQFPGFSTGFPPGKSTPYTRPARSAAIASISRSGVNTAACTIAISTGCRSIMTAKILIHGKIHGLV
jgi:hypothetical protein